MQEVAHFLIRHQHVGGSVVLAHSVSLIERMQTLARSPKSKKQVQKCMREPWDVRDDRLEILPIRNEAAKDRIGQGLAHIADQLFRVLMGECADVDREVLR